MAGRAGRWPSPTPRPTSPARFRSPPGGLGVVEATLVAITVGFGSPRTAMVPAVLGYRVVNFWLPLLPGAVAYLRLRLTAGHGKVKGN